MTLQQFRQITKNVPDHYDIVVNIDYPISDVVLIQPEDVLICVPTQEVELAVCRSI